MLSMKFNFSYQFPQCCNKLIHYLSAKEGVGVGRHDRKSLGTTALKQV